MPHMRALLSFLPHPPVAGDVKKLRRLALKAGPNFPICRVSPLHLAMQGFFVAAALALVMDEC